MTEDKERMLEAIHRILDTYEETDRSDLVVEAFTSGIQYAIDFVRTKSTLV